MKVIATCLPQTLGYTSVYSIRADYSGKYVIRKQESMNILNIFEVDFRLTRIVSVLQKAGKNEPHAKPVYFLLFL